jgi:hypothetical protein
MICCGTLPWSHDGSELLSTFMFLDDRLGDGKEYLKADYTIQATNYPSSTIHLKFSTIIPS